MRPRVLGVLANNRYREPFLLLLLIFALFTILTKNNISKLTTKPSHSDGEVEKQIPEYPSASNGFLQQHLDIDRLDQSGVDVLRHELQEAIPNLPIDFWQENENQPLYYKNQSCAPFPELCDLKINNFYWQTLNTINGTFNLFGAYYDVRRRSLIGPSVRILAMIDRVQPTVETYCQIWFSDRQEPLIVKTTEYRLIWLWQKTDELHYPHLISCPIPNFAQHEQQAPIFVSLVEKMCDRASNSLRVIYNTPSHPEKKDGFAVCVKYLDILHEDESVRLIEWIELMKILGARKILFYNLQLHKNMSKVLEYYERRDEVEVTPISFVGSYSTIPNFQNLCSKKLKCKLQQFLNELISLNDCFYKNMYRYDYITLLDTDEVIVPLKVDNWTDLMSTTRKKASFERMKNRSHFTAKNVLFIPNDGNSNDVYQNIPSYMYMLQHVQREEQHMTRGPKTFFDPEIVETVHNHWPVSCLNGICRAYGISTEDAQLQHYRNEVYLDIHKSSADPHRVNDTTIWKYKKPLIDRSLAALYDLDFFD